MRGCQKDSLFFYEMEDVFFTIEKESQGIYKDKGSKFLAFAYPVKTEDEIKEKLVILRKEHHGARHHCYAWRLGTEDIIFRANDDGEPSSTAGKPILGQLQSNNVTNILIVVVRYFGGTLLGVSGLINAYRNAAADALKNVKIIQKVIEKEYELHFTYNELSEVMNLIKQENLTIIDTRFEENCSVVFSVRKSESARINQLFSSIFRVRIKPYQNN